VDAESAHMHARLVVEHCINVARLATVHPAPVIHHKTVIQSLTLTSDAHHLGTNDVQPCTLPVVPQRVLQLHPVAFTPVTRCILVPRPFQFRRRPECLDTLPLVPSTTAHYLSPHTPWSHD
jgi:hypothetical protein